MVYSSRQRRQRSGARKQAAITAVAKYFRATLKQGAKGRDASVVRGGKRIALEVVAAEPMIAHRSGATKPRLRFDRVVLELLGRLRASLQEAVPSGRTVMLTVTAPIRLASKTAVTLDERVRALLGRSTAPRQLTGTIHGNGIQLRIIPDGNTSTSRLVGFVHNPDSDPSILFELTSSLLRSMGAIERKRRDLSQDHWLVIAIEDDVRWIEIYRHVCEQLFSATDYQRVLLVSADGQVATLDGS